MPAIYSHPLLSNLLRLSLLCISSLCLSGCVFDGTSDDLSSEHAFFWDPQNDNAGYAFPQQPYPEEYDASLNDAPPIDTNPTPAQPSVLVPTSYHLGTSNAPLTSKDEDQHWISQQNPNGYTIEVTESDHASEVAKVLQQLPKSNHHAEVKKQSGQYVGFHGTYMTHTEAEDELNKLPSSLRSRATIKSWHSVQAEIQSIAD